MLDILNNLAKATNIPANDYASEAKASFYSSLLKNAKSSQDSINTTLFLGRTYMELGREENSIRIFEKLVNEPIIANNSYWNIPLKKELAISWLRTGERINCISNHGAESCIFPIQGNGLHKDKTGSARAIELYKDLLEKDPQDLESRWLLNIAYMTTNGYPEKVPEKHLIKGLGSDTSSLIKPFTDVSIVTGLNTNNMAGGGIIEDFNNDGYMDIVTSGWGLKEGMHFCKNNASGTFSDLSEASGLKELKGGLNIMQTDYNNDGFKDIFVLRGAWKGEFGREPNSLLKNNGDGTFTDVTIKSGLFSQFPTQTATWADFNNDGWLDVFIGNETDNKSVYAPCELFISQKDGTFKNMSREAGTNIAAFVKGVSSGDFNNDGLMDIFLSTMNGYQVLLKNQGEINGVLKFKNISAEAGFGKSGIRTFGTWFWDYNNDGFLDILVNGYHFSKTLGCYSAMEALGQLPDETSGQTLLYRNRGNGTFEEISRTVGLNKIAFSMGCNFGDIDNDGYSDIYLGTGNPYYTSLVPNKMFKNVGGKKFIDVTSSARVGSLQKGHAVSFGDLDNDGDLDIHIEMGGAFEGDAYQNSLFINPGQNDNNWINLSLEGTTSNRAAIGAKLKVTFRENGLERSVYRVVNSGGSFGASPLGQHIGIGKAKLIETIEIQWPGSKTFQVIKSVHPNQVIEIKEGVAQYKTRKKQKLNFTDTNRLSIGCAPY